MPRDRRKKDQIKFQICSSSAYVTRKFTLPRRESRIDRPRRPNFQVCTSQRTFAVKSAERQNLIDQISQFRTFDRLRDPNIHPVSKLAERWGISSNDKNGQATLKRRMHDVQKFERRSKYFADVRNIRGYGVSKFSDEVALKFCLGQIPFPPDTILFVLID